MVGKFPSYAADIRLARYIGIPPWQLDDAPIEWLEAARVVMNVEREMHREDGAMPVMVIP